MATPERFQVDYFAIIVLIAAVLLIVFLIIAAIYFMNLMNLKPPSKSESTFLFWTSMVLLVILLAIIIYAFIRLFAGLPVIVNVTAAPAPAVNVVSPCVQPVVTVPQVTLNPCVQPVPAPIKMQPCLPCQPTAVGNCGQVMPAGPYFMTQEIATKQNTMMPMQRVAYADMAYPAYSINNTLAQ